MKQQSVGRHGHGQIKVIISGMGQSCFALRQWIHILHVYVLGRVADKNEVTAIYQINWVFFIQWSRFFFRKEV
jgi:hypothetical protein